MTGSGAKSRVFAVVLAAGSSTRFGSNKMLARAGERSLVRRAMETARDACGPYSLLVAGHDACEVLEAAGDATGFLAVNEHYTEGIGASIAAGVSSVAHAAGAVLLILADQPLVTAAHLARLVAAWGGADDEIVATAFADTVGPPVLFPPGTFPELAKLGGDEGARAVLRDPRFTVTTLRFDDAAVDVDTPADLAGL